MITWIKKLFSKKEPSLSESAKVMARKRNSKPKSKKSEGNVSPQS